MGSLVERTISASLRYLLAGRCERDRSEGKEQPTVEVEGACEAEEEEEVEEPGGDHTLKQSLWPRSRGDSEG